MEITHVTCKALTFQAAQLDIKAEHYAPHARGSTGEKTGAWLAEMSAKKKKKVREEFTEAGGRAYPVLGEQSAPNP